MLSKRNIRSQLVTLMLVAGFCGGALSHSARISAQGATATPTASEVCASDTGSDQNENEADDAADSNCADEQAQDDGACILIGAGPAMSTTQTVDDQADGETNDDAVATQTVDDQADGETNDDAVTIQETPDATEEPAYNGSIAVDETPFAAMSSTDRCAALTKLATITPQEAQATAQANGTGVVKMVEIDAENGSLVYSVEMDDDSSVKVDAGNGTILVVEPADTAKQAN